METGVYSAFKNYISGYKTFATDLNADATKIAALPPSQYYYCFTGLSIDQCGARYKKEDASSNANTIVSLLNMIPIFLPSTNFLPTITSSVAMNVYARQKLEAIGPCGREDCEFSNIMSYDQRKTAAGVPLTNTVTEFYLYPQYGNSASYKGAVRYIAVKSEQLKSLVKPGTLKVGVACGCSPSKGSICVMAITENYSEASQSTPIMLANQPTPDQCYASCIITNFKQLTSDINDRIRQTIVDQSSTKESISYDLYSKINLFKTKPGTFYENYGSSVSSASLAFTSDSNPILYSKALSDALREKLLKDNCGTTSNLDTTSRFTSISIKYSMDITYSTDFLTEAVQNSDFLSAIQSCESRFIGIACALKSSSSTICKLAFASDLWVKSSYTAQTPVWTSSSTADWSSVFCSNIYCKLGTATSGCKDTTITSTKCLATIPSCTDCQYDSVGTLSICNKCTNNLLIQEGKCVSTCTGDYKYFTKSTLTGVNQCVKTCPSTMPNHLATGECVKACISASLTDASSTGCISCPDQFSGCDSCAAVTDSSTNAVSVKCRKCNASTPYFSNDFTKCVSSCSTVETLVKLSDYGYCLKCPAECTSCSVTNNKISCSACTADNAYDESTGTCAKKCPSSKYNYNGKCVDSCPSGYSAQLDTGKCVTCPIDGCVECFGLSSYYTCNKCAPDRVKTGSLLTGYKCTTTCDVSNANYCMKNGQCIGVTGYKDSAGNCKDCPENCSKCSLNSAGVAQCSLCNEKYCMNKSTNTCQLAINSDYVLMTYVSSANTVSVECKDACDSGYIPDSYDNCIKCDTSKYPQCSDTNCASWTVLFQTPYCVKCKEGYQPDILNKNICKKIESCVGDQIEVNGKCVTCKDVIPNCNACIVDGTTPKCKLCFLGYSVNSQNTCTLSSCTNSILSSDGSSCVTQCSVGQYVSPTLNKCTDCTISNCKNCFLNKGTEVCYECGKDPSSANTNLSTDLLSCKSSCTSPQVADSKKRCVSPPSNVATFSIAKEQDWSILDQLKKGIDVTCPHILSANTCNSGYNLLVNSDGNQYCDVCASNTFYDSSSKSCKSCGDNCSECQSLTECKTCTPGTYPVSGKCYWNCPRGMYVSGGTCTKCDDACGGLNGSCFDAGPNSCDGCQFDTSTNKFVTYLVESVNQCVSATNCPLSTYPADNGKCMPCDSGCTSCTGLGSQNCLDAKLTSVSSSICSLGHCTTCTDLTHCGQCESTYQLTADGTCVKVCDQGYYSDDNINCKQCDDTCLTCTKAGECTQCKPKTTDGNYYGVALVSGKCQYKQCSSNCIFCKLDNPTSDSVCSVCSTGYKLDSSSNKCVADSTVVGSTSCLRGERLVDSSCIPCQNPYTERCYTASRVSGVIEVSIACQKGYYLSNEVCVSICKDGYFADQILGWCVKCGCNCNTCTNYVDKCNDKCSTGTFSSTNDRCEYPLSSSPVVTAEASTNSFSIKFPANVAVLNRIDTDITTESIYNSDNVCGDDAFDSDWTSFLASSLNVDFIVSDLKSKLNSNEQNELDYLLSIDYSTTSKSLISNNLLNYYYMQNEKQLDIVKLIALYRWSLFGKTDLAVPFTYSDNNFYTDSSAVDDVCGLIFDVDSVLTLGSPDCSFVTNSDKTMTFTVTVDDISKINPSTSYKFNDVIYYVASSTKLPIPSVTINVPTPNIQKPMTIVIDMKDSVTKCEDLTISYQNSQGLGYDTTVSIQLDSIKDTATGAVVTTNISSIQKTINALLTQLLVKSKDAKSMSIVVSKIYLSSYVGKTIYFAINFKNKVTGEVQNIPKKVSIVNDAKLEILDQALLISRTAKTQINTVKYVSCSMTPDTAAAQLTCKATVYQQSTTAIAYTTSQVTFDKCTIDPTKINVDNIARVWVETKMDGALKTIDVPYKVDKIQCSCDLSQIKAAYGTSDSLSISSIKCPVSYALKWTFKKQSGSGLDVSFNSNSASFKILDKLASGTTYKLSIDITNSNMNVVYGTCTKLLEVLSQTTALDTQIRDVNSGSLQGSFVLDVLTFSNNKQIYVDSVTLTLTESGSTTDLLKTTFSKAYKLVDNSKLTFSPGVWKSGTTYVLTAVASLKGATGKATRLITVADNSLFSADFSPKIASTGDTIKITITNKSSTQCLFCAVGFYYNDMFDPFEVLSEPDQLCGSGVYRDTSIVVPTISDKLIKNTDLAVLCIGDDTNQTIQQRTNLQRSKISITSKTLKSADILTDSALVSAQDYDRACLSVLALPDDQCPDSSYESICDQAIQSKQDLMDNYSGQLKKLWKDLTNKLVYSLTKVITCGDAPFSKSQHGVVKIILNGICKTFASDDSVCKSPDDNVDSLSCASFDSGFINKILVIVNNIEAKIVNDDNFTDLLSLLDLVQGLIECASTDAISAGSGTEVHSNESSTAILKVKSLDINFKALVKHSGSARNRRYLASVQNTCGLGFDKIASSLSGKENLIIKVQYNQKCSQYTSKACDGSADLTETPSCCDITIQSSVKDTSGATSVQTIEVTSDQNGISSLTVPASTCSATTKCAYYDKSKSCWSTDGVTTSDNCSGCKSTHFSTFSFINPSSKSSSSSSSNSNNPANAILSVATANLIMIYENILLYICALLNIYLFMLFIKTCRNKSKKISHVISKNVEQINVKGYTKTLPAPRNEDDEQKIRGIRNMFEINSSAIGNGERAEESKVMSPQKNVKEENDVEQSYDAIGNENVIEAQSMVLEKSYCSSYFSTFCRKHRIVSSLVFNHPTLSYFSRGINVAFCIVSASFLITIGLYGTASILVSVLTIIAGLILSRVVCCLLELLLNNKSQKYINLIQAILISVLLIFEGVVIFIPSQINDRNTALVNVSIIVFLLCEFIFYELISHAFHVRLSRKLVKDPSKLNKMSRVSKLFLNPIVYEHINQFS